MTTTANTANTANTATTANTMTTTATTIIAADTPEQVAGYRLLAIRSALKLERMGLKMGRGVKASKLARDVLKQAGKKAPAKLAELHAVYGDHLREIGILAPAPAPVVIHYGTH